MCPLGHQKLAEKAVLIVIKAHLMDDPQRGTQGPEEMQRPRGPRVSWTHSAKIFIRFRET